MEGKSKSYKLIQGGIVYILNIKIVGGLILFTLKTADGQIFTKNLSIEQFKFINKCFSKINSTYDAVKEMDYILRKKNIGINQENGIYKIHIYFIENGIINVGYICFDSNESIDIGCTTTTSRYVTTDTFPYIDIVIIDNQSTYYENFQTVDVQLDNYSNYQNITEEESQINLDNIVPDPHLKNMPGEEYNIDQLLGVTNNTVTTSTVLRTIIPDEQPIHIASTKVTQMPTPSQVITHTMPFITPADPLININNTQFNEYSYEESKNEISNKFTIPLPKVENINSQQVIAQNEKKEEKEDKNIEKIKKLEGENIDLKYQNMMMQGKINSLGAQLNFCQGKMQQKELEELKKENLLMKQELIDYNTQLTQLQLEMEQMKGCQQEIEKIKEEKIKQEEEIQNLRNSQEHLISASKENVVQVKGEIINGVKELEMLTRKISKNSKKIILNLIYKASADSDKAEVFHDRCDEAESTLVLVETDKGKRFGGYTSLSWEGNAIEKKDPKAFVFSLDKMECYDIIDGELAIGCYPNFGPVFLGCQIKINDDAFTNGGTTFEAGINYKTEEDYELSGGEREYGIKEIEVYEVIVQ